jgi:hypothetical protein
MSTFIKKPGGAQVFIRNMDFLKPQVFLSSSSSAVKINIGDVVIATAAAAASEEDGHHYHNSITLFKSFEDARITMTTTATTTDDDATDGTSRIHGFPPKYCCGENDVIQIDVLGYELLLTAPSYVAAINTNISQRFRIGNRQLVFDDTATVVPTMSILPPSILPPSILPPSILPPSSSSSFQIVVIDDTAVFGKFNDACSDAGFAIRLFDSIKQISSLLCDYPWYPKTQLVAKFFDGSGADDGFHRWETLLYESIHSIYQTTSLDDIERLTRGCLFVRIDCAQSMIDQLKNKCIPTLAQHVKNKSIGDVVKRALAAAKAMHSQLCYCNTPVSPSP